jgi:hypothetical protein
MPPLKGGVELLQSSFAGDMIPGDVLASHEHPDRAVCRRRASRENLRFVGELRETPSHSAKSRTRGRTGPVFS